MNEVIANDFAKFLVHEYKIKNPEALFSGRNFIDIIMQIRDSWEVYGFNSAQQIIVESNHEGVTIFRGSKESNEFMKYSYGDIPTLENPDELILFITKILKEYFYK